MSGFFTRLAQRTLGTAQAVRPSFAPRFAKDPRLTEDFHSTEGLDDQHKQTVGIANKNDKLSHMSEIETLHTKHQSNPQPTQQQGQPEQNNRISNIVEPAAVETKEFIDPIRPIRLIKDFSNNIDAPKKEDDKKAQKMSVETQKPINTVRPIEEFKNRIDALEIQDDTEAQKIPNNRANEFGQFNQDHVNKGGTLADAPLVPIPHHQPQAIGNSDIPFKESGYPIDVQQAPRMDGHLSADLTNRQGLDKSQTINVTIGRIEVRAVHSAPTPIKRERAKTNPALSLEDYLQQRQKGER